MLSSRPSSADFRPSPGPLSLSPPMSRLSRLKFPVRPLQSCDRRRDYRSCLRRRRGFDIVFFGRPGVILVICTPVALSRLNPLPPPTDSAGVQDRPLRPVTAAETRVIVSAGVLVCPLSSPPIRDCRREPYYLLGATSGL